MRSGLSPGSSSRSSAEPPPCGPSCTCGLGTCTFPAFKHPPLVPCCCNRFTSSSFADHWDPTGQGGVEHLLRGPASEPCPQLPISNGFVRFDSRKVAAGAALLAALNQEFGGLLM